MSLHDSVFCFDASFHRSMMARAIQLAERGRNTVSPNPVVGCVIVSRAGKIIGEGYHVRAGEAHAEIIALQHCSESPEGATVYVTLEPCSHQGRTGPCAQALAEAKVATVVYGMEDPNPKVAGRGLEVLRDAGIEVMASSLESEAFDLNPGFIRRMRYGLPYVRCKMAMSLDGRTAMASGESRWVTGPAARADIQHLRARSCAIVTGVGSVLLDDPSMNVRLEDTQRQPKRIVVDSALRTPVNAEIFQASGDTIIAHCMADDVVPKEPFDGAKYPPSALWHVPSNAEGKVDLRALNKRLAAEGCNDVLVEAGATLAGQYMAKGLIDELIIYMAGKLMGSHARPLFDLPIEKMSAQLPLTIRDIRAVGSDWRITAYRDPES